MRTWPGGASGHVRIYAANNVPQQGDTISANFTDLIDPNGAINTITYQWQELGSDGETWSNINAATSETLDLSDQAFVGKTIRVTAITTDERGGTTVFSSEGQTVVNKDDEATGTLTLSSSESQSWQQLGFDINGEAEFDQSGYSVSLSADGSTVAIGANGNDGNGAAVSGEGDAPARSVV